MSKSEEKRKEKREKQKLRKTEESWGKERKAEEKEGGDLLKEVRIQRRKTLIRIGNTLWNRTSLWQSFYQGILETTIHSAVQWEGK